MLLVEAMLLSKATRRHPTSGEDSREPSQSVAVTATPTLTPNDKFSLISLKTSVQMLFDIRSTISQVLHLSHVLNLPDMIWCKQKFHCLWYPRKTSRPNRDLMRLVKVRIRYRIALFSVRVRIRNVRWAFDRKTQRFTITSTRNDIKTVLNV